MLSRLETLRRGIYRNLPMLAEVTLVVFAEGASCMLAADALPVLTR
ncbi:hypothetical protein [Yersinia kristensenii]|nr:hypothetical protein [Yersinia kristensenii]